MASSLKIAFLTSTDPNDKTAWSGIHFKMYDALKKKYPNTIAIGPVWDILPRAIVFFIKKTSWLLFKKRYNKDQNLILSFWYAIFFFPKLRKAKFDLIFAPSSSSQIAFLKTKIPIYSFGDSSFSQMNGYYPSFSNLSRFSDWESEWIEQKALGKAKVRIFASEWAASHAINHYHIPKEKAFVVPFGANLLSDDIQDFNIAKLNDSTCRLLFLGVDWERKGGQLAFETLVYLNQKKVDAELLVVGCKPPQTHPKMKVIPFLNKNNSDDYQKFISIFNQTHFLFMPARAECAGIVYAEASAFYIPSIATNTGGVSTVVENGVNGILLDMEAGAAEYASIIEEYFMNKDLYHKFALNAHHKYKTVLNWQNWASEIESIINATFSK
jgi:glycosyltransferase involved in cell wall biosynthesis